MISIFLPSQIHHFLDFVKQIYKDLPKVVVSTTSTAGVFAFSEQVFGSDVSFYWKHRVTCHCLTFITIFSFPLLPVFPLTTVSICSQKARYFENPQVIAENTVPSPEMVGMITSVLVKTAPEREDSETRTVSQPTDCRSLDLHCFNLCIQYCLGPPDGSSAPCWNTNRSDHKTGLLLPN